MTCAAALATLLVLRDEQLVENAAKVGRYFKDQLTALRYKSESISDVRGLGLMLAVEIKDEKAREIAEDCLGKGYVINNIGQNILRFLPPLCVSTREVEDLIGVLEELLL